MNFMKLNSENMLIKDRSQDIVIDLNLIKSEYKIKGPKNYFKLTW